MSIEAPEPCLRVPRKIVDYGRRCIVSAGHRGLCADARGEWSADPHDAVAVDPADVPWGRIAQDGE